MYDGAAKILPGLGFAARGAGFLSGLPVPCLGVRQATVSGAWSDPYVPKYEIEFYEDEHGNVPVLQWLREGLSPRKRRALGTAMNRVLQTLGVSVCDTKFGRQLGKGLFEFRLRGVDLAEVAPASGEPDPAEAKMLLRVFCHPHGNKLILLLGGYDKGEDTSAKRQTNEIAIARSRLKDWRNRQRRMSR